MGVQKNGGGRNDGLWDNWRWASRRMEVEEMMAYGTIGDGRPEEWRW